MQLYHNKAILKALRVNPIDQMIINFTVISFLYYLLFCSAGEEPPSPQDGTQSSSAAGSGPSGIGLGADSESDESEVGRLQALLEARGLPPHLFGALGPRMQHILHRSMSSNSCKFMISQGLKYIQICLSCMTSSRSVMTLTLNYHLYFFSLISTIQCSHRITIHLQLN